METLIAEIEKFSRDNELPKKMKDSLERIINELKNEDQGLGIRVTSAIYDLERISNSIHIPMHSKTALWDIIGNLERLKEEGAE